MNTRKRNDLSAFKGTPTKSVLSETPPEKSVGRPRKQAKEKRGQKVLLSLTLGEEAALKAHAGMVPLATFVTNILREQGILDKPN